MLYVLYVLYLTRQAAEPPLSPASLLYVLYVLYLTRQAAEPPLSPASLLYVLYVLYVLYARNLWYMCYIGPYSTYSTYSKEPGESGCSVACLVRYSTYSTYSKEPGESGCSVACLVRYSTYSTYSKDPGDCEGLAACATLRSIGAWRQSWAGRRIALVNPALGTEFVNPVANAGLLPCNPVPNTELPRSPRKLPRRSGTRRARARTSAPPRRAARCSPRPGRRRERGG